MAALGPMENWKNAPNKDDDLIYKDYVLSTAVFRFNNTKQNHGALPTPHWEGTRPFPNPSP